MTAMAPTISAHHAWAMVIGVAIFDAGFFCFCLKFCFKVIKIAGQLRYLLFVRVIIAENGVQLTSLNDDFLAN